MFIPGWWFQTCFVFHFIYGIIIILPIDKLIFWKRWLLHHCTTNQIHVYNGLFHMMIWYIIYIYIYTYIIYIIYIIYMLYIYISYILYIYGWGMIPPKLAAENGEMTWMTWNPEKMLWLSAKASKVKDHNISMGDLFTLW